MRLLILVLFGFASTVSLQAAKLVEGVIYLKNGTRIEYTDLDRIALPKQNGTVRAYLHAFSKQKQKFTYQPSEIDSVVCWHPQAWEHPRRFYYAPSVGWCWVYFETPYIRVCVYAKKGYGIGTNGGILCWQRRGTFSSSRLAYYLQKKGGETLLFIGSVNRRSKDIFRERIARYINDDPLLSEQILRSNTNRSKTVLMLKDYNPSK